MKWVWGCGAFALTVSGLACEDGGAGDQDGMGGDSGDQREVGFPEGEDIPLTYEFRDANLYLQSESGAWFRAQFGSWGAHLGAHTGHLEGDPKSNWDVLIRPEGELVEMVGLYYASGNEDGVCDSGELCGVTEEVALANDVWYHNPYGPIEIINLSGHENGNPGEYIDEPSIFYFDFFLEGRFAGMTLGHLGELSPELMDLVAERLGDDIRRDPASIGDVYFNEDPIRVPSGMRLGRAQRRHGGTVEVNGETIYLARAQIEWFSTAEPSTTECAFLRHPEERRQKLQTALDALLTDPIPGAAFDLYGEGQISIYEGAQGRLCSSTHLSVDHYDTLSSENSRAWTNVDDVREVLAIVPIAKDTAGYQEIADRLHPRGGDFLFGWGAANDETLSIDLGGPVEFVQIKGQVLDLADATAASGSFVLRVQDETSGIDGAAIGVQYRMLSDHLLLRFGDLAPLEEVELPQPVEEDAVADRMRTRRYQRNWQQLTEEAGLAR